ncbi:MAG: hypothetical protein HW390_1127 [Candidatus Brocadiaceae bacterium]|nr:hypothetical protein [Candidatus Brocadiaceae bacterium]
MVIPSFLSPLWAYCRAKRFFAHLSIVLTQSVLLKGKLELPTQTRSQAEPGNEKNIAQAFSLHSFKRNDYIK